MEQHKKHEVFSTRKELADFFRGLADALENGDTALFSGVSAAKKIKIGVTNEFGQFVVKAKFKPEKVSSGCSNAGAEAEDTQRLPKYKDLKKRMKRSFKMIRYAVRNSTLPPKEAVDSFLADSRVMVQYSGYGDEFYDEYIRLCDAFGEAYKTEKMPAIQETVVAIARCEARCHAKYD